jgi:colanic acid/amylovoran biosynthesis glycosyltransferase
LGETGLSSVTRLMGYQPPEVLREEAYRHHIFLSPSRSSADGDTEGGAPVSLIEMAATGMPIVSTRHADIPTVVRSGESALLAEEGNVEELSECLFRLATHPEDWERMGAAGRLHVEQECNALVQGRKLARLYHALT